MHSQAAGWQLPSWARLCPAARAAPFQPAKQQTRKNYSALHPHSLCGFLTHSSSRLPAAPCCPAVLRTLAGHDERPGGEGGLEYCVVFPAGPHLCGGKRQGLYLPCCLRGDAEIWLFSIQTTPQPWSHSLGVQLSPQQARRDRITLILLCLQQVPYWKAQLPQPKPSSLMWSENAKLKRQLGDLSRDFQRLLGLHERSDAQVADLQNKLRQLRGELATKDKALELSRRTLDRLAEEKVEQEVRLGGGPAGGLVHRLSGGGTARSRGESAVVSVLPFFGVQGTLEEARVAASGHVLSKGSGAAACRAARQLTRHTSGNSSLGCCR